MRIGLFIDFPEDELSGGGQHQVTILRALSAYGRAKSHHFYVFSRRIPAYLKALETATLTFVPVPPTPLSVKLLTRLYKEIRRTTWFYHPYPENLRIVRRAMYDARLLAPLLARYKIEACSWDIYDYRSLWVDQPYVLTIYDLQHRYQPEFPEVSARGTWLLREEFCSRAIPRAFRLIVDSETGKEDVLRFYGGRDDRIKVLPYLPAHIATGVDPANDQAVLDKYRLQSGYLFYPAQFWSHKNHITLLLALKWLRETHNLSLSLALAGREKNNLAYLKSMVPQLGLEAQVSWLGFVPDPDMPALYRQALALAFPSYFGPTNIPPLEAFGLGCPVIAADVCGIKEQLGQAALLVDPTSVEGWGAAIYRLYSDPQLRETLIQRGQARVGQWTPEDYVRGLVEIFDELEPILRCWTEV